ncbi:sel1 repeat family protein [Pseudomonas piscis]|uniref:sel1 repeat family protein n=1 Tax=Pseudomonas piscis TaxID=2614538 RepID=UPI00384E9C6D
MKLLKALPLILLAVLAACSPETPQPAAPKVPDLNDSLPKLSLQTLLPQVPDTQDCNRQMDSDVLYGIGMAHFNDNDYPAAKNCLVLAAPEQHRAFCYLSMIAEQENDASDATPNRQSFDYLAYAASQNDWCAEYGLYQVYRFGRKGMTADRALAQRWLERSAQHGYPVSQQALVQIHEEQGDLASAYAWSKIIDDRNASGEREALKARLSPEQLLAAEQHYNQLLGQVTSKEAMYAQAREEDIGRYSATIQQAYPDTFRGMASQERRDFVRQAMLKGIDLPYIHNRRQITSYMVISRRAQLKQANADVLQNKQIVALLGNDDLTVAQILDKAQVILDKHYK